MARDLLNELQFLGVTARIKRLSDALSASIRELYQSQGLDIEPSWHLVFLMLEEQETATMTEVADALQLSQPALTRIIGKMVERGYVYVIKNPNDGRKKQLKLTGKAQDALPKFHLVWDAGRTSVQQILESNESFFESLHDFEMQIAQKSFKDRALAALSCNSARRKGVPQ